MRPNDDGRATAERAARWLRDEAPKGRNPLRDPSMGGPTQQFGAEVAGPARLIPNEYFGAGRVSGARVEHNLPPLDSALAERGAHLLDAALARTFGDRRDAEAEAWIREAYAVPQIAAAHAYGLGYAEGADAVYREAARDVPRLRKLVNRQDREIDRLRAQLAGTLGARLWALLGALWARVAP